MRIWLASVLLIPLAIQAGHWSLEPVRRPSLPALGQAQQPANAIDAFVLAKLAEDCGLGDDEVAAAAVDFLDSGTDERPLCMVVGTFLPHCPFIVDEHGMFWKSNFFKKYNKNYF